MLRWLIVGLLLAGCASMDSALRYEKDGVSGLRKGHDFSMCSGGGFVNDAVDRCMAARGYRVKD